MGGVRRARLRPEAGLLNLRKAMDVYVGLRPAPARRLSNAQRGGGPERDQPLRPDQRNLGYRANARRPRASRCPARLADAPLAAQLVLEVLDGIGECRRRRAPSPAGAIARSSNWPAGPTKGRPTRSSWSPGCSPTSMWHRRERPLAADGLGGDARRWGKRGQGMGGCAQFDRVGGRHTIGRKQMQRNGRANAACHRRPAPRSSTGCVRRPRRPAAGSARPSGRLCQ